MTTQRLPFPVPDERAHLFADKVRMTPVSALATRIAALRPVPELVPVTIATFLVFFLGCGRAWVVSLRGLRYAAEFGGRIRASQSVRARRAVAEMWACGYRASNPWKPPAQTWSSAWPPAAQMRVA